MHHIYKLGIWRSPYSAQWNQHSFCRYRNSSCFRRKGFQQSSIDGGHCYRSCLHFLPISGRRTLLHHLALHPILPMEDMFPKFVLRQRSRLRWPLITTIEFLSFPFLSSQTEFFSFNIVIYVEHN